MKRFDFDPKKVKFKQEKMGREVHLSKSTEERGQYFGKKWFPYAKGSKSK